MYFLHTVNVCGLSTTKFISAKRANTFISHFPIFRQRNTTSAEQGGAQKYVAPGDKTGEILLLWRICVLQLQR
jgi:hypothetical protein